MTIDELALRGLTPQGAVLPELITVDDVSALIRVSRRTVFRMRQRRELPEPVEVSRNIVRWRLREVLTYIEGLKPRAAKRRTR